jgi:hypothetical protein
LLVTPELCTYINGPFPRIGKPGSAPLALVFLSLALTRNKELDTADVLETPLERFDGESTITP